MNDKDAIAEAKRRWSVQAGRVVVDELGNVVAICHARRNVESGARDYFGPGCVEPQEADRTVYLVAAAPSLLAALEAVVADLGDTYGGPTWDAIHEAIAAARGERVKAKGRKRAARGGAR